LAQQGPPPGRPPRERDFGRRGYDRDPREDGARPGGYRSERHARPERPERPDRPQGRDRPQRRDRGERADRQPGWTRSNAFGPDTEADLPPWAGPPVRAARPAGTRLRPPARVDTSPPDEVADAWDGEERPEWPDEQPQAPGGPSGQPSGGSRGVVPPGQHGPRRPTRRSGRRAAAARLRRSRRRVYLWCGLAIVACVIAAVVIEAVTQHTPVKLPYVTSLQPGEFKSAPNTCTAVSPAVLSAFVPGAGQPVSTSLSGTDSQCTFTVDRKPNFLVLAVSAQSYQPFAAASGDGSASDNALDQFGQAQQTLAHPPKKSPLPPATITLLAGLGKQAFMAVALEHVGHIRDDVVTVMALYRNVIVTAQLTGQDSGGFGPVSLTTLEAGAQAAAKSVLAKALTQPTA
jgi:hypothetical protein